MAEEGASGNSMGQLWKDNPWIVPVLAIAGDIAAFFLAGPIPALIGLGVILVLLLVALWRSWQQRGAEITRLRGDHDLLGEGEPRILLVEEPEPVEPSPPDETSHAGPGGETADGSESAADELGPYGLAFLAFMQGNDDEARRLLDEWIAESGNHRDGVERQAQALRLRIQNGKEPSVLDDLRRLADDEPENVVCVSEYVQALHTLGESKVALDELAARSGSLDEADATKLRLTQARILNAVAEYADSLDVLGELDVGSLDANDKADAIELKGYALEGEGRISESYVAFEEFLRLRPISTGVRFHLAYQYSEDDFRDLAVCHYRILLEQRPTHGSANNNLGVELQRIELPLVGTPYYLKGAEAGEQIAAANIAHLLIDKGFQDLAREWIERGKDFPERHQNLAGAEARLIQQVDDQTEKQRVAERRGRKAREAITGATAVESPPQGSWVLPTGEIVTFESDGTEARAKVPVKGATYDLVVKRTDSKTEAAWTIGGIRSVCTGLAFSRGDSLIIITREDIPGTDTRVLTLLPADPDAEDVEDST